MGSGGARVGAGRKPKNPELMKNPKKSEQEMETRKQSTPKYEKFPEQPEGMLEAEKKIWDEMINEYKEFYTATGVMPINSLDAKSLRNYCMYSAILETLREELKKNPKAIVMKTQTTKSMASQKARVGTSEREVINPIYAEIIKIETRQSTLAMQLNLTPDARARMGIAIAKNKEDTLGAFLSELDD